MLSRHLNQGGLVVSWVPTPRSELTFRRAFDHIARYESIMIGSNQPIDIDTSKIIARSQQAWSSQYYSKAGINLNAHILQIIAGLYTVPSLKSVPLTDPNSVNTDLFPRDEFES